MDGRTQPSDPARAGIDEQAAENARRTTAALETARVSSEAREALKQECIERVQNIGDDNIRFILYASITGKRQGEE